MLTAMEGAVFNMTRISKDLVDVYFQHGVDLTNRRIFLFDEISEVSVGGVIKGLYLMEQANNKLPIELFIGSFGGSEYEMFALYDTTRTLSSPIHTVAIGKCMSAAPLLIAGGEKGHRYATPNTFFMIHEGSSDFGVSRQDDYRSVSKHLNQLSNTWSLLMAKHTKKPEAFWNRLCKKVHDTHFDVNTAIEWGIIDHVWDQKEGK